uniref:Putative ribonuclease H-like domain-containing protein n=1 Tax=Tanacetum cinerariifolium TaxID=118510 RepID=A0A699GMJ7_TANCI|nr:putative ribonuclease H-like domain-containing protein [Tanacetum cinerariifolium]
MLYEWNTHVVVWRNKFDLDKISIDDLYNNFKIVEQEVKRHASPSLSSGSQNMAFVLTLSTSNNDDVSTVFGVSTASAQVSTANLSDATVHAFLANQTNGGKRFFQKTGKNITINGSDIAGYDKAKVECFNCHKMGAFCKRMQSAKESGKQNHKSRNHNKDSECGRYIFQSNGGN